MSSVIIAYKSYHSLDEILNFLCHIPNLMYFKEFGLGVWKLYKIIKGILSLFEKKCYMIVMITLSIVVNVKNLKTIPSLNFWWSKSICCAPLLPNRVNIHLIECSLIVSTYHRLLQKQCMLTWLKSLIFVEMLTWLGSNITQELNSKWF